MLNVPVLSVTVRLKEQVAVTGAVTVALGVPITVPETGEAEAPDVKLKPAQLLVLSPVLLSVSVPVPVDPAMPALTATE